MDWVGLLLNFGRWEGLMKIRVHRGAEVGGRGAVRWSVESPTASRIEDSKLGQGNSKGLAGI